MDETRSHEHARFHSTLESLEHWNDIGRHDLAEAHAREALALHPNDPFLLVALARALKGLGRDDEATQAAQAALHTDPEFVDALVVLGSLAQEAGRHRDAEEHYLTALKLYPTHPGLLICYGNLMLKVGHHDKAERLVRTALEQDPDNAAAHSLLSLILTDKTQIRGGEHAQQGVRIDPDRDFSHGALGAHYYMSGRPFKARDHLREALRIDPTDTDVEQLYLESDRASRWLYLPMYYWSLLIHRLPGRQFAVWGAFIFVLLVLPRIGVSETVVMRVAFAYIAFVIYTWLARPLTSLWIRWRPPQ